MADSVLARAGQACVRVLERMVRDEMREVMAGVYEATAPGRMEAGRGAVARDLRAIFSLRRQGVSTEAMIAAFHRMQRGRDGRVTPLPEARKLAVQPTAFTAYLRTVQRRVGLQKSGWAPAMRALGITIETAVVAHGGGRGSFRATPLQMEAENRGIYDPRQIEPLAAKIIESRRSRLERELARMLDAAIRKEGL